MRRYLFGYLRIATKLILIKYEILGYPGVAGGAAH